MDFDPPLATAVLAGAVEGGASERAWRREDLQRRGSFGDLSDAESDCSQASRVSLKRTWSESSQGRTESSGSLAAASEPGLGRSGTWPLQVDDDEDMWRVTGSLSRERVGLVDQLSNLTAEDNGQAAAVAAARRGTLLDSLSEARSGGGASAAEWMSLDPLLWPRSEGLPASGAESSPFEGILGAPHVPVNLPGVVDDVGRGAMAAPGAQPGGMPGGVHGGLAAGPSMGVTGLYPQTLQPRPGDLGPGYGVGPSAYSAAPGGQWYPLAQGLPLPPPGPLSASLPQAGQMPGPPQAYWGGATADAARGMEAGGFAYHGGEGPPPAALYHGGGLLSPFAHSFAFAMGAPETPSGRRPKVQRANTAPEGSLRERAEAERPAAERGKRPPRPPGWRPKEYKCKRCGAPKKGHVCLARGEEVPRGTSARRFGLGSRKEWSPEEDRLVLLHAKEKGLKWRLIAESIPGRSDDAVRNRWNRLQEHQLALAMQAANVAAAADAGGAAAREEASPGGAVSPTSPAPAVSSATTPSEVVAATPPLASPSSPGAEPGLDVGAASAAGSPTDPASVVRGDSQSRPSSQELQPQQRKVKQTDRTGWSAREDAIIAASVGELGHRWYVIAQRLPSRTDHAIRNRWHRLQTMGTEQLQQRFLQGEQQLYSEQQQQLQRPPPPPQQQQFGYGQSLPLLLPRPPPPQQFPNALHPLHPLPPSPSHPPSECPSEIPIAFATIDSSNEISG